MTEEFVNKIFEECPTRFKRAEKNRLLLLLRQRFVELGYPASSIRTLKHKGIGKSHNFVVGRPDARYVFTAHYDTPGRTGFLLFSAPLFGQTWANIVYTLLCVVYFAAVAFAAIHASNWVSSLISSDGIMKLIIPLLVYLAILLIAMFLVILPVVIRNKNNRNDNTSGVLALLELAELISADPELRDNCCFVFFDNEEWGLLGSAKYSAWLKGGGYDISRSVVLNFDCVGVGDKLVVVSTTPGNKTAKYIKNAYNARGEKIIKKSSMIIYMSDHASLRGAVMLTRMKRSVFGPLYIPNIHTAADTECDMELVRSLASDVAGLVKDMNTTRVIDP